MSWTSGALLTLLAIPCSQAADNLKAFPAAEPGMQRYVVQLPPRPDEADLQVQLVVGKTMQLDEQNRYFLGGEIKPQPIQGWGFTAYGVSQLGPLAGTLMAPDPSAAKVERFVTLGGEPYLVRYNSRLPLVVYVPDEAELRYRIWTAGAEQKATTQD